MDHSENIAPDFSFAADQYILTETQDNVIRVFNWSEEFVSIGRFTKVPVLLNDQLRIIRRDTGGRAVLHNCDTSISIIGAASGGMDSINKIYNTTADILKKTFADIGLGFRQNKNDELKNEISCIKSAYRHEIYEEKTGMKLCGLAITIKNNRFLLQGSIFINYDFGKSEKIFSSINKEYPIISVKNFKSALIGEIMDQVKPDVKFIEEITDSGKIQKIINEKYRNEYWNYML